MGTLQQLYNWFYLNKEFANSQISNCKTPLRVAPIKIVSEYEPLDIDYEHFAFAEKNKNWEIEYHHGLKNYLWIEKSGFSPIFIFDNHNHAITFRYNIIYNKKLNNIELIHIDQHSDCRENKNELKLNWESDESKKVFNFCNENCNVGNFILPAIESWIISNQIQIRSISALRSLEPKIFSNFILDLDLDFCLDWINKAKINTESIDILKLKLHNLRKNALCTTIATSPYFLNQDTAIEILNTIFEKQQ